MNLIAAGMRSLGLVERPVPPDRLGNAIERISVYDACRPNEPRPAGRSHLFS